MYQIQGILPHVRLPVEPDNSPRDQVAERRDGQKAMSGIGIREVRNSEEFAGLRATWDALLERSRDRNPFLSWDWLYTWWKHFGAPDSLNILVFEADGEPVGIAPLMRSRQRVGPMSFEFLENLGRGLGVYGGVILADRGRECMEALLSYVAELASKKGIIWRMSQIPADSQFLALLSAKAADHNQLVMKLRKGLVCPYVKIEGSWETYYQTLGRNLRRNLRRTLRDFCAAHVVSISARDGRGVSAETSQALEVLYEQRWPGEDKRTKAFFKEVSHLLEEKGWGRFSSVTADGKVVSAVFGIDYAGKYYNCRAAFDLGFSLYSVGQTHYAHLMQEGFARGLKEFDFLIGEQAYKYDWANAVRENFDLTAYGTGVVPRLRMYLLDQLPRIVRVARRGLLGNIRYLMKRLRKNDGPGPQTRARLRRDVMNAKGDQSG